MIDEVINPFDQYTLIKRNEFRTIYLGNLVTVSESGLLQPTKEWDDLVQGGVTDTYPIHFYDIVKSAGVYYINDGLFVLTIPLELLTRPKSVQVLTFLSHGSFLRKYLEKLIKSGIEIDLKIDELPAHQLRLWKNDVINSISICDIPSLSSVPLSFNQQTQGTKCNRTSKGKTIAMALYGLKRRNGPLVGVPTQNVMITCAKQNWFGNKDGRKPEASFWSKDSKLFGRPKRNQFEGWTTTGVKFVPNTTRGTNLYSDCSHAIYLYDQHPNPQVANFLGFDKKSQAYKDFEDAYALTELVQWLFRCQIRRGGYGLNTHGTACFRGERQKATVFIPSGRMRKLLIQWLNE